MKAYLNLLFVVTFAALGFTLSSCSNDDDDALSNWSIKINGEVKQLSTLVTMKGEWDSYNDEGHFAVAIDDDHSVWYYVFHYENNDYPKVGDNFAKMNLKLQPLDGTDIPLNLYLDYQSGSVTVKSVDKANDRIVVEFSNLKLSKRDYSYVFDGVVPVSFDF